MVCVLARRPGSGGLVVGRSRSILLLPGQLACARQGIGAQIGHYPGEIYDEQTHGPYRRDRIHMVAGRIVRGERQAQQHDDEHTHQQQRRRVARQPVGEAHHAVGGAQRSDHDHQAQHEHRVGEDRAYDRRLRDDQLALLQGEDDHEQLRQVAERGLHHSRDRRPEALAQLLGGKGHDPREARERKRGHSEARHRRPLSIVGRARDRRQERDRSERDALCGSETAHLACRQ